MADNPITREEQYLAYLNGSGNVIPSPITRVEKYLYELCMNGISGGGTAQSKKFELIEEIIVEGDDEKLIERSTEPNGTPYSFEEVYIRFEMEATNATGANFVSWANNKVSCGIGSLVTNAKRFSSIQYQIRGGLLFTSFQSATTDKTWASAKQLDGDIIFVDEVNHLKFTCNVPIPVGSKITIYAIRK